METLPCANLRSAASAAMLSERSNSLLFSAASLAISDRSGRDLSVCSPQSAFHVREFGEDDQESVGSPRSDLSAAGSPRSPAALVEMPERLQLCLAIVFWWSAAAYVTVMFKLIAGLKGSTLPPFILTGLVNTTAGLFAWLLSILGPSPGPMPEWQWQEVGQVLVLGLLQGFELGCLNKSLEFLSVSDRTMLQNLNVLLVMSAAWTLGLERLSGWRILAVLLLSCGGLFQGFDYVGASSESKAARAVGLAIMMLSLVLATSKWTMAQFLTQRVARDSALGRITKLQLAARTQPLTGLTCFALAAAFEAPALEARHVLHVWVLVRVLLIAAGVTVIVCCELKVVHLTSAVACSALINVHHIPMALLGAFVFHDRIDVLSWCGFGCCVLGGICYALARHLDPKGVSMEQLDARLDSPVSWRRASNRASKVVSPAALKVRRAGSPPSRIPRGKVWI